MDDTAEKEGEVIEAVEEDEGKYEGVREGEKEIEKDKLVKK